MADPRAPEPKIPGITTIPHPMTFEATRCSCNHEDWQHTVHSTCAGGVTAQSCPCTARWRRVLP